MQTTNTKDPVTLIRKTFLIGFVSMGQVAAFMFLYSAAVEIYTIKYGPMRGDLSYGLSLHYSLYLLGALAAANSIAQLFAETVGTKWLAAINTSLLWLFFWADILPQMPNRFLLVSLSGMATFWLAMLFLYRIPAYSAAERRAGVI